MTEQLINQRTFTQLYDRHWPSIFYFVRQFIADTAEAEDITAETFIKLWQRRDHFDNEKSMASFLHTTARNASIDWLRAEKRQLQNMAGLLHVLQQSEEGTTEVKPELLRLIQAEIDKLPFKIRRVFILSYLEGKTNEEIATLLRINNQSVSNHKTRALKLLRLAITGKHWLFVLLALYFKLFTWPVN